MFKNITGVFRVTFKDLELGTKNFTIKRRESGAFSYGDHSCHSVKIEGGQEEFFDTRYDQISTNKVDWCNFWVKYIYNHYEVASVDVISYETKMVKEEK